MSLRVKIRGGQKLAKYLQDMKRQNERLRQSRAEVGFFGEQISTVALTHELGLRGRDGGVRLPARPAFWCKHVPRCGKRSVKPCEVR